MSDGAGFHGDSQGGFHVGVASPLCDHRSAVRPRLEAHGRGEAAGAAPRLRPGGAPAGAPRGASRDTRVLDGFFIHVDADCLDDDIMPAVDYRMAGGLSWDELASALQIAIGSARAVGIEMTIYNPSLDVDGAAGRGLVSTLSRALGSSAPARDHH
ncbi:arginase family protein [Sorangium sp. So ce260]